MTTHGSAPTLSDPPIAARPPRDLTPDVARGLALLGITVVNAPLLAPHSINGTTDEVTSVLVTALLENRSWPMFALLFGFGIAAIGARLDRQGLEPRARDRVLRRRNAWLVVIGLGQVVLVFWGDILGVYGLTGLVVVAFAHRSTRTLLTAGALSAAAWLLGATALAWGGTSDRVPDSASWVVSVGERLAVFVFWTGANSLLLTHLAPMLVGVALFRIGALHRPVEHLRLHRRLAVIGLSAGLAGAVPLCLDVLGVWDASDHARAAALGVHAVTGLAQGVGYVSLVALWSARRAPGAAPRGAAVLLAAIGRRSLTVYLVHAVLLGLLLSTWALDLAPHLTTATTYGVGAGAWVVCACVAIALAAAGRPGPADDLLRRLTYGPRGRDGARW